jgi:hypothetical protein
MKLFVFISSIFIFALNGSCVKNAGSNTNVQRLQNSGDSTVIYFEKKLHDFGLVGSDEEIACRFGFSNTGDAPLIIQDVVAGCGCTDVKYPTEPVRPGVFGAIEVTFNTRGKNGHQRQVVKVISNGSVMPTELIIRAQIKD